MDYLDIFDPNKDVKQTLIPCPRSQRRPVYDSIDSESIASTRAITLGTDYVAEYVEKEEKELLESVHNAFSLGNKKNQYEAVSEGTIASTSDFDNSNLLNIYKTYNFGYRPKTNFTISSMKDKIVSMIETNSVVIIQGPTGCGKTTQMPQFILDASYKKRAHCNIIVTQPRRLAAITIAKRVSQERDWPVGTLVGYQVGMINHTSPDTRLTYCTTGVLLHKLINAKHMLDYTHVILDEVHERDQDMDFLFIVVRKFLRTNSRTVKVILMSATFNVEKFAKYFSSPVQNQLVPAPIVDIAKRNYFNINIFYLCQILTLGQIPEVSADEPKISNKMLDFCVRIIIVLDDLDMQMDDTICDSEMSVNDRHVILIFLPGIHEIEEMYSLLSSSKYTTSKWDIVVLHSSITNEQQQRIFVKPPQGYRRIILSTNIAESSITVPDVKYVIDFCLTKQLVVNSTTNFQSLQLAWASKANCDQRAGRTGRVMDGRVYRLVPKSFYENVLPAEGKPEMLRAPLENLVLQAKMLDMGEPKAILALSLDPPYLENLERTILLLKECGALLNRPHSMQQFDGDLTDLGRIMAHLPLDIHVAKLIVLGHVFSILRDTIIIGASMAAKDMFSNPFQQKFLAYNVKLTWAGDSCSDCIAFLNVFKVWQNEKANRRLNNNVIEKKWAQRNFVQIRVLREVEALVHDITTRLQRMGITETVGVEKVVWNAIERPFVLKVVIAGAFYPNYFVRHLQKDQGNERESIKLIGGLDPTKTVYLQGWPLKQPGQLYSRRIQELFKDCCYSSMEKIKVFFEASTRIYVQFEKNEASSMNGAEVTKKIALPVYKAIKMRQCNMPMQVPILNEQTALQRAEERNLLRKTSDLFFTGNSNEQKCVLEPWARPQLPGLDISHIHLRIVHLIDLAHFWARSADEDTWNTLQRIQVHCNTEKDLSKTFDSPPKIGTLVLAPLKQNDSVRYCRARVEDCITGYNDVLVAVFFIDYGCKNQSKLKDVRGVQENSRIRKVPALAFECILANLQPSVTHSLNEQWSKESYDIFNELIYTNGELYGNIYSVVNNIVTLKLITEKKNGKQICVNDYLIEKGVASWKEEDYFSRCNNEIRKKCDEMSTEQRIRYEELQYDQNYVSNYYPDPPSVDECTSSVNLRGPFSPLEIMLVNLTRAGKGKRVSVDMNSVNSVLLDTSFEDPYERLLVAAVINQNMMGNNLSLRHTTLMPNLPGLTALLSLIFSPHMELRRNTLGTRYIGALCGLGYDPLTKESLFPEHDMEVQFDVEITMDDLQNINKLRHWMNMGMQINKDYAGNEDNDAVIASQNKVKEMLLKIVEKLRSAQSSELINNFGRWSLYDESLFLSPGRASMVKNSIYNLHNALELKERNENLENMIEHLVELRSLAIEDVRKNVGTDIHCKLCDVQISNISNLRAHLYTKVHRDRVNALSASI